MPVGVQLGRTRAWRAAPSLMALSVASVVGVSSMSIAWPDLTRHVPIASPYLVRTASQSQIEVTAVPKRRIADLVPAEQARAPADDGTHDETRELASRVIDADCARSTLEDRTFYSPSLDRVMPYGIYLPPGYCADPDRQYPVVYLLHGGPTNYSEWPQLRITNLMDELIAAGEVEPMILVFPEGESSFFFNHPGGPAWGHYIAHDLVDAVDASERTRADRASRVIAGLSMGGHGALQLGFNYPEVFGIIAAHGPALRDTEDGPEFFGTPDDYAPYDPVQLVATVNQPPLALWIDAPEDDPWLEKTERIHRTLTERGWPHSYRINPGTHSTVYWLAHITDYIRFYAEALRYGQGSP